MSKYIGITIGPIFDTISETTKPASLWFASSIFSNFTERLCEKIKDKYSDVNIISPYYDKKDAYTGVGKYHDRVIFMTSEFTKESLKEILNEVKAGTIDQFPKKIFEKKLDYEKAKENDVKANKASESEQKLDYEDAKKYLCEYIQTHYVVLDESDKKKNENAIFAVSDYLDSLELCKHIPQNNENSPFKALFGCKEYESKDDKYRSKLNELLRETDLFTNIPADDSQLKSKKTVGIRSIEEIISIDNSKLKKNNYYAVVSADGDRVGKKLQSLTSDEDVKKFSKACLEYSVSASKMIFEFGGMTIYAGGDDLLFIAPIEDKDGKHLLTLCKEINQKFQKILKEELPEGDVVPTISFGIAIRYKKFPLYETMDAARDALKYVKRDDDREVVVHGKNAVAVTLQKHSGQSVAFVVPSENTDEFVEFLNKKFDFCKEPEKKTSENSEEKLHSIIYKLESMKHIIKTLDEKKAEEEQYIVAFENFFDNPNQGVFKEYVDYLAKYYANNVVGNKERKTCAYGIEDGKSVEGFATLLRYKKFLIEKGEE